MSGPWAGETLRVTLPGDPDVPHRIFVWSSLTDDVTEGEMRHDAASGTWQYLLATPPDPAWLSVAVEIDGGLDYATARVRTRSRSPRGPSAPGRPRRGFGPLTHLRFDRVIGVAK